MEKLFQSNNLRIINELLELLKNHFKNRIYLEIQRHNENEEVNFENYILNLSNTFKILFNSDTRGLLFRQRNVRSS